MKQIVTIVSDPQAMADYVTITVMNVISTFFGSPFSDQSTTLSTRQPVFVRMLKVRNTTRRKSCERRPVKERIRVSAANW